MPDAVEVLFTGLDRGIEGGEEQAYQRSLGAARCAHARRAARLRDERRAAAAAAWLPAAAGRPGLVWDGEREMAARDRRRSPSRSRLPEDRGVPATATQEDDEGEPVTRIQPRALMVPPGIPDFFTRARTVAAGAVRARGPRVVRLAPVAASR